MKTGGGDAVHKQAEKTSGELVLCSVNESLLKLISPFINHYVTAGAEKGKKFIVHTVALDAGEMKTERVGNSDSFR